MSTLKLSELEAAIVAHPRILVGHWPTPLESLENLSKDLGIDLWVKRDDLSGLGQGGNKIRQLEHYMGEARANNADTILITGAVQSNFVRAACAFAAKIGLHCHVQLEERVANVSELYRNSGNAFLDRLFGAHVHSFPQGEDEAAADASLDRLANKLREQGMQPYTIHLAADKPPFGAIGYANAACELTKQIEKCGPFDAVYVASGSASTHCGLLYGLRYLADPVEVIGVCVRRAASTQKERVARRCEDLARLLELQNPVHAQDVRTDDRSFGSGYGVVSDKVREAISKVATREGMLVDPVYTGRVMATLMDRELNSGRRILFWHTGGEPALFAYADRL